MKRSFFAIFGVMLVLQYYVVIGKPLKRIVESHKMVNRNKISVRGLSKNIEFAFCKAKVQSVDSIQLNELAKFMMENKYIVSLRGHADAVGSYVGNWKMSEERALTIKAYLLKKGVLEDRIITAAYGSTIPIANNKTSYGRKKNRRVEIRLKQIDV